MSDTRTTMEIELGVDISGDKAVRQMKNIAAQVGKYVKQINESGDFKIFQNLIDYLSAVESKIVTLYKADPQRFNNLFGQNGKDLQQAMHDQLNTLGTSAEQVTDLMSRISVAYNNLSTQQGDVDLAQRLQEVAMMLNQVYSITGQNKQFDLGVFSNPTNVQTNIQTVGKAIQDLRIDWQSLVNDLQSKNNDVAIFQYFQNVLMQIREMESFVNSDDFKKLSKVEKDDLFSRQSVLYSRRDILGASLGIDETEVWNISDNFIKDGYPVLEKLAKDLGIVIPKAAQDANNALSNVGSNTENLNKLTRRYEAVKKLFADINSLSKEAHDSGKSVKAYDDTKSRKLRRDVQYLSGFEGADKDAQKEAQSLWSSVVRGKGKFDESQIGEMAARYLHVLGNELPEAGKIAMGALDGVSAGVNKVEENAKRATDEVKKDVDAVKQHANADGVEPEDSKGANKNLEEERGAVERLASEIRSTLISAIEEKNRAFSEEQAKVTAVVDAEKAKFQELAGYLNGEFSQSAKNAWNNIDGKIGSNGKRNIIRDESVAANRIEKYHDAVAANAANKMQSYALPGTTPTVTGMKSLKDGVVEVSGVLQTGEKAWGNYTVKITESGRVISSIIKDDNKLTASKLKQIELQKQVIAAQQAEEQRVAKIQSLREAGAKEYNTKDIEKYVSDLKKKKVGAYDPTAGDTQIIKDKEFTANSLNETYAKIAANIQTIREQNGLATQEQIASIHTNIQYLEQYIAEQNKVAEANKRAAQSAGAVNDKKLATEQLAYATLSSKSVAYYQGSTTINPALEAYRAEIDKLTLLHTQMQANGGKVSAEMKAEYDAQAKATANARKELEGLITASEKLAAKGVTISKVIDPSKLNDAATRTAMLREEFNKIGGRGKTFESISDDASKLFYTIKAGNGTVQHMALEFNAARTAIVQTSGDITKTTNVFTQFFDAIKTKAKFFVSGMGLRYAWTELKKGVGYVKELDAAMTELRKVSNGTEQDYANILSNLQQTASEVARTPTDLIKSATDWARSGMSLKEAELLAKNTAILMNTSDMTDASQASNVMIATMKAYHYEAEDTMNMIDKFNAVGNNFAISTADAADSLTRSGAALYAAGNDLEQSLALTATANTFVQNPESVGNALKTLSMRIRGTKVELEQAGEDTDGMATSVSKLRDQVMALTNTRGTGGFDILKDNGDYKNTYEILLGISEVWQDMADIDQAALLELIAGKRQGSIVSGILDNPELLKEAYETAADSAGYAEEKNAIMLESVGGKINILKANLQTLWTSAIDSNVLKFFLDIGNALLVATKNLGGFNVAMGVLTAFLVKKSKFNLAEKIFGKTDELSGKRVGGFVQKIQDWRAHKKGDIQDTSNIVGVNVNGEAIKSLNLEIQNTTNEIAKLEAQIKQYPNDGFNAECKAKRESVARLKEELQQLQITSAELSGKTGTQFLAERGELIAGQNKRLHKDFSSKSGKDFGVMLGEYSSFKEQGKEAQWLKDNIDDLTDSQVYYLHTCQEGQLNTKGYTQAIGEHNTKLRMSSIASKAAAIGMQAFNMAVSFGVGLVMSMAMSALSNWIHKQEEMAKVAKEASEEYERANKTYQDNAKTINEVGAEYEKLSKGVDENGNNISLTTEEFEKYHDITSKIAEMFPELVTGYDAQGNAILSLADNAGTATEELKKLNDEEKRAAAGELMKKSNDIIQTVKNKLDPGYFGTNQDYYSKLLQEVIQGQKQINDLNDEEQYRIRDLLLESGIISKSEKALYSSNYDSRLGYTGKVQELLEKVVRERKENAIAAIQPSVNDVKETFDELIQLAEAFGQNNEKFIQLDEERQKVINNIIHSMSQDQWLELLPEIERGPEEAFSRIYEAYINLVKDPLFMDLYKQIGTTKNNMKQYTPIGDMSKELQVLEKRAKNIMELNSDLKSEDQGLYDQLLTRIFSVDDKALQQNLKALDNAINQGENLDRNIESIQKRFAKYSLAEINFAGTMDLAGDEGKLLADLGIDKAQSYIRQQMRESGISLYGPIESFDDLKTKADEYAKAMNVVNEVAVDNTALTKDQAAALEAVLGDLSLYKEAIDDSNVVKSTQKLRDALTQKKTDISSNIRIMRLQYSDLVNQLSRSVHEYTGELEDQDNAQWDTIQSLLEQISSVDNTISRYEMLETQLLGTADAYAEFQKAQEIDASIDNSGQLTEMIGTIQEGLTSGKVGSQAFQAAVKNYMPYDVWKDYKEDAVQNIKDIQEYYNNTLSKYITTSDDKHSSGPTITADNVIKFYEDAAAAGVVEKTADGYNVLVDSLDDAAEKMKVTKELFYDMASASRSFNASWDKDPLTIIASRDTSYDSQIYQQQQGLVDMYEQLAELKKNNKDNSNIIDIAKLEKNINDAEISLRELNLEVIDKAKTKREYEVDVNAVYEDFGKDSNAFKLYSDLMQGGNMTHKKAIKQVTATFGTDIDTSKFEDKYKAIKQKLIDLADTGEGGLGTVTDTSVQSAVDSVYARLEEVKRQLANNPDGQIKIKLEAEKKDLETALEEAESMGFTIPTEFDMEDSIDKIVDNTSRIADSVEIIAETKPQKGSVLDILSNAADLGAEISQISTEQQPNTNTTPTTNKYGVNIDNYNKYQQEKTKQEMLEQRTADFNKRFEVSADVDMSDAEKKVNDFEKQKRTITEDVSADTTNAEQTTQKFEEHDSHQIIESIEADPSKAQEVMEQIHKDDIPAKQFSITTDPTDALNDVNEVNKTPVEDKQNKITTDASPAKTTTTNLKNWLWNLDMTKNVILNASVKKSDDFDSTITWFKQQPKTETKTKKIEVKTTKSGSGVFGSSADGNAHVLGTAFAGGHWGAPRTEEALVGELGPEIVVTPATGKWRTVGDNGAEFTKIHSGDIIFNHLQTQQLLKNRHLNSRGSAFASGTAYGKNSDMTIVANNITVTGNTGSTGSKGNGGGGGDGGKGNKGDTSKEKTATEKLVDQYAKFVDWVATKLERAADATAEAMDKVEADAGKIKRGYKFVGKGKGDYNKKGKYLGANKGSYDLNLEIKSGAIKAINDALKTTETELKNNRAAQIRYKGMLGKVQNDFQKIKDSNGKPILTDDMIKKIQNGAGISLKKGRNGKGDYDSKGNYKGKNKGSYNYMFADNSIVQYGSDRQKAIEQYKQWWDTYANTGKNIKELEKQKKELQEKKFQEIVDYYSRLVDWVQIKLERIAANTEAKIDAIDNYTQRLNNTYTKKGKGKGNYTRTKDGKYKYVGKNKGQYTRNTGVLGAITDAISATRTERDVNQQGYNRYMRQARDVQASMHLSSKIVKKIQSGAIEITEYDDKTQQKIEEYQKWYNAAQACKKTIKELNDQEKELYARRFDEIEQYYSSRIGFQDSRKGFMESRVAYREAQGYLKSSANTNYLLSLEETQKAEVQKQKNDLLAELNRQVKNGQVVYKSKEWYEYKAKIDDCTQSLLEHNQAIEDLKNQLGEIRAYNFDHLRSEYSNLGSELSNLYDLVSKKDVWKYVNDKNNGKWTKEGLTAIGIAAQQMELAKREANAYAKEITYLTSNYKKLGYSDVEYKDKVAELTQAQWAQIDAYESAKDKIQSLNSARVQAIKDGIQKEIDAYSELINKQKKSLQEKRETHDYNKKVADQQKSIAKIQSQIDALALDSSQSAAAKRKKLEAELLDEKTNLNEIYYDHDLEMQEEALDKNLEIFQKDKEKIIENLEKSLEDIETITKNSISSVKDNASQVSSELSTLSKQYGLTISTAITQPWKKGTDAIQSYTNQFKSTTSIVVEEAKQWVTALQGVENQWNKNIAAANKYADIDKQNTINNSKQGIPNLKMAYPDLYSKSKKYVTLEYGAFGSGNDVKKGVTDAKGNFINYKVMAINKKNGTVDLVSADGKKKLKGFSVRKLRGYKFGTTNLPNTGFVRIDEDNLEELVLHAGKDGKIQYLTKGSGVVPNDLTKNLMQWGKLDPRQILMANTPTPPSATHFTNNTINLNIGEVVHIDHADRDSIPDITNAVQKQIDQYMKNVNQKLRIKT